MAISLSKVSFAYGTPKKKVTPKYVLKDVNIDIDGEDEFITIVGHTGSGKSTLVQILNGLLLTSIGEVKVFGKKIGKNENTKLKDIRKRVGLVFQFPEYQLFEETIYKDIAFGPKNFGVKDEELEKVVKKSLELVGLDESYLEKSPFELSGGQKRRVAIAGILALDPDVLILDEPTAGLDPQGAIEMMELFKSLNRLGKTIIIITHEMDFVLKYCDRVVVMKKANIISSTTPVEFFYNEELLKEVKIEEPLTITFAKKLLQKGMKLNINKIKDVESLANEICLAKGGVNNE